MRPTPGRTRETLFNWLRGHLEGARCLDAFAGSGALGIEALSQGAAHCTFIERHRQTATQLERTLDELSARDVARVITGSAERVVRSERSAFDIIFLDPPFGEPELPGRTLSALAEQHLIGEWVYLEQPRGTPVDLICEPVGLSVWRTTRSGDSEASLLRSLAPDQGPS